MTMKVKLFWITLLSLYSSISFCQKNNNEPHPNFIVILVDDQGWNGTSVQMKKGDSSSKSDYHHTPNLEKLAASGMRFSQAYSASPVCAPSRYSLQFGKSAARLNMIRVQMNTDHINHTTELTIPKILKKVKFLIWRRTQDSNLHLLVIPPGVIPLYQSVMAGTRGNDPP